ncbi:MAG: Mut7-C ubiquitin/RNAse domain-containing protein [Gammaproteobacteria bacterium]|jgi:hypothetical protein|nr:Mut7-C ubiquitin/RNAse domain-containing protein [Gammaproteobacteria bacterium]
MARATLRFYEELNDFLPQAQRKRDLWLRFDEPAPVRHLIETCGVPHTEVEIVLLNGESVDLEARVRDGDRLAVYPVFESLDVRPALRIRAGPLRSLRFAADAHLGRLARDLRLLGFDTWFENDAGDDELARLSAEEGRVVLTRDRQLLMRREVARGCYLRAARPEEQLAYLVKRLQLCGAMRPFSRCMACNAAVAAVAPDAVIDRVPAGVAERQDLFWQCPGCGRVYWQGTHWRAMAGRVARLCGARAADR